MSDLTTKFAALEVQLAESDVAIQVDLNAIREQLELLNTQLDTQTINNAANTKALLAALGQTGACFPCPTPSIFVPPVDTTPKSASDANCQRSQGIIATIHAILVTMDTLQSFNVIGSFNVINDAISQVIDTIAAGDTIPLPSFPEAVNIVGNYISYAGERLFSGVGLIEQFDPLETALTSAIWAAGSPESAQAAYNAIIDGSDISFAGKYLIEGVAYASLWSYYYDPETAPDLSGFSGIACSFPPGTCFERDLVLYARTPVAGSGYGIDVAFGPFESVATVGTSSGDRTFTPPVFWVGNIEDWTVETLSGECYMTYREDGPETATAYLNTASFLVGADPFILPFTGFFAFIATTPTVVRLCSPGS